MLIKCKLKRWSPRACTQQRQWCKHRSTKKSVHVSRMWSNMEWVEVFFKDFISVVCKCTHSCYQRTRGWRHYGDSSLSSCSTSGNNTRQWQYNCSCKYYCAEHKSLVLRDPMLLSNHFAQLLFSDGTVIQRKQCQLFIYNFYYKIFHCWKLCYRCRASHPSEPSEAVGNKAAILSVNGISFGFQKQALP